MLRISAKDTVKLAVLGLERYMRSEEGLLIVAKRVDGDYEQHLGMIGSVKAFKEWRRNERSNILTETE